MISLFKLKQNDVFRTCYKTPYFIKNLFLMIIQAVLILIIYLIFFRADGGSIENAYKILRGLNSKTFNYLTHSEVKSSLGVGKELPIFHMPGTND